MNIRFTVGLVVYDTSQKRFLILRRNPERYHGWGLVKGGIEQGETAAQACLREAYEEIGIQFFQASLEDLGHASAYYDNTRKRVVHVQWFLTRGVIDGPLKLQAAEWAEYRWASLEEALYELSWQSQQRVIKIAHAWLISR